jgi:hypothetical protein
MVRPQCFGTVTRHFVRATDVTGPVIEDRYDRINRGSVEKNDCSLLGAERVRSDRRLT